MMSEREFIIDETVKCVEGLVNALVEQALAKIERLVRKIEAGQQGQEWFTVKETADLVGKSPYTIREHVKQGRLKAERMEGGAGGKGELRISRDEINRYRGPEWSNKLNPNSSTNGHAGHGR